MQIAMIQDKIVPLAELDQAHMDRGTYFGDGVYEVVRSYGGHLFALAEHLERFNRSLRAIGITGVDIGEIDQHVERAYESASIADAKVYFHITRGSHPRSHVPNKDLKPNFFLTVTQLPDDSYQKADGIAVSTYPDLRWKRCDIKSLNLLPNVLARLDAEKKGCAEAVLVAETGEITEGSGSAFFAVSHREKKLLTRPLGRRVLPSITRKFVMQLAPQAGLAPLEKPITPAGAQAAEELFIAVTTRDIVPVVEFDGAKIGNGKPGQYTKLLMAAFAKLVNPNTNSS
jgi:D-alanine transaminase